MPTMDMACFFGDDKSNVNFMSATVLDELSFEKTKERFVNHMKRKAKMRYCIKEIMGDYYWCDTKAEVSINDCFVRMPVEIKGQKDFEKYIEKNCNTKLPFNTP